MLARLDPARRRAMAAVGLLGSLVPAAAFAGNTEHPRTPVLWPEAPCIQTVVRSEDPLLSFAYAIPFEDTALSIDELDDSRTHQFIGFCRQWPAGRPPPRYISLADLDRAIDAGFEDAAELADPEATLETSATWAGCWTRITTEDQRRPITEAAAAEPVVWDTAGLDPGTWVIAGYTWEPPFNLWSRAPWVVRVVDQDPQIDPTPVAAAAALLDGEDALAFDATLELEVCVAAEPGSTLTLEWAVAKHETLTWAPAASASVGADEPTLVLPFAPPEPSWGATVLLRASVEQPAGPPYVGHALAPVIVFKPSDGGGGDGDGDGDPDPGTDTGADGGDTGAETGSEDTPADGRGSGRCSVAPGRGTLGPWMLALVWLVARRRRSAPARRAQRC